MRLFGKVTVQFRPTSMRYAFLSLLSLATAIGCNAASIRGAQTEYMEEGQFQLLREFFTGRESTGNRLVLRTNEDNRDGQYFELRLEDTLGELPHGTRAVLEVISTEDLEPKRYEFAVDPAAKSRSHHLLLGLTGPDWPSDERKALAWRIELRAGDKAIGEWKSFLWELP